MTSVVWFVQGFQSVGSAASLHSTASHTHTHTHSQTHNEIWRYRSVPTSLVVQNQMFHQKKKFEDAALIFFFEINVLDVVWINHVTFFRGFNNIAFPKCWKNICRIWQNFEHVLTACNSKHCWIWQNFQNFSNDSHHYTFVPFQDVAQMWFCKAKARAQDSSSQLCPH